MKFRIRQTKKIDYLFSVFFCRCSDKEISHTNKTPSKRFMNKIPAPPSKSKRIEPTVLCFIQRLYAPVNPEKHPFIREISSPNYTIPWHLKFRRRVTPHSIIVTECSVSK